MPLTGFQKQFAPPVQAGIKRQTIRAYRKRKFKIGDILYTYSGLRTKQCQKLGEFILKSRGHLIIESKGYLLFENLEMKYTMNEFELHEFAKADGFKDWGEMVAWFKKAHGLPFTGVLLKW